MAEKKVYPKSIGGLWSRQSSYGEFFTGKITVNGVSHSFVVFKNDLKQEGEDTPDWRIYPPKDQEKPAATTAKKTAAKPAPRKRVIEPELEYSNDSGDDDGDIDV